MRSLFRGLTVDKKFSELVGCLAFDSDSNLSLSTDDHNTDTDSSLEFFICLGNSCNLTPLEQVLLAHSYKSPHHCPAEMMVELVNHKKNSCQYSVYSIAVVYP